MYPNPVINHLVIQSQKPVNALRIYDVSGKLIKLYNTGARTFIDLDVDDISGGIYFVKADTESGTIVKKFIKR